MNLNTYVVVGVSTGIGRALVEELLDQRKMVIGIGRRNFISHGNFSFHHLDLSDVSQIDSFSFPAVSDPFVLIYNAGVLGEIAPFVEQENNNAFHVFQVNYFAATAMAKLALRSNFCKQIIFISSGAAKRPIASWSQYCASKAALDMFAQTLQIELLQSGCECRVFSIAPGVVDTPMQAQIRASSVDKFPQLNHFIQLHERHELASPQEVAKKLIYISRNIVSFPDVFFSLRDVDLH
jgi:benzil reductase ((S)-benzoin forming)